MDRKGGNILYNYYSTVSADSQAIYTQIALHKKYQLDLRDTLVECIRANNNNISDSTLKGVYDCGKHIYLHQGHIIAADFCKQRMCPMCQWRASRVAYGKMAKIYTKLSNTHKFIFITYTLRNTKDIEQGINTILKAYKRLLDKRLLKRIIKGSIRTVEVTYNADTHEWHPHLHCLYVVDNDYFTNPQKYITTKDWVKLWRQACHLDYDPICYAESITGMEAVAEIAKYVYKPISIKNDIDIYKVLYKTLYKRRLRAFTGVLRQYAATIDNIDISSDNDTESDLKPTEYLYYDDKQYTVSNTYKDYVNIITKVDKKEKRTNYNAIAK